MAKKNISIDAGSGNVFSDLGYPDAKERQLKVRLAMEINSILGQRDLTQAATAKILGLQQPHVSDLTRYRLNRFSAQRLMEFLALLGRDVEIRISGRKSRKVKPGIRVSLVA